MNSAAFLTWCESWPAAHVLPLVVGVLNVTPDSFSDGGRFVALDVALDKATALIAAGADVIDIGGESTRPGATPVGIEEELARVIPVIKGIRARHDVALSIDTYKPDVMRAAVAAGADVINDIMALSAPGALATAVELDVPVCLMHMQGNPQTMQSLPHYATSIEQSVSDFFLARVNACVAAGLARERLMLDPGFGFGKSDAHNLRLTRLLQTLVATHARPMWFGCSRKNTLGTLLNRPIEQRMSAGLALAVFAQLQGVAVIRTHDVAETRDALNIVHAVMQASV